MKIYIKLFILTGLLMLLVLVVVFGAFYYFNTMKPTREAKQRLLEHNVQISEVYSLKDIRGYGEGPEYSGMVKMNGERCRIWTFGDGVITESICEADPIVTDQK